MRYFRDTEDDSAIATDNEHDAEAYSADDRYVGIDKREFDDLIDSDPARQ